MNQKVNKASGNYKVGKNLEKKFENGPTEEGHKSIGGGGLCSGENYASHVGEGYTVKGQNCGLCCDWPKGWGGEDGMEMGGLQV